MEGNKGTSYIKLIFVVILLIIIAIVIGKYINKELKKEDISSVQTNMLLVQAKIQKLKADSSLSKDTNLLIGIKATEIPENISIQTVIDAGAISQEELQNYYLLTQDSLNQMELNEIVLEEGTYYLVDYENGEVIYTDGYVASNGNIYFKLSEIKDL